MNCLILTFLAAADIEESFPEYSWHVNELKKSKLINVGLLLLIVGSFREISKNICEVWNKNGSYKMFVMVGIKYGGIRLATFTCVCLWESVQL